MFLDSVEIFIASGNGGPGAVSFRREKFVLSGGPDGGDGGRGGDVYFVADTNTTTLSHFRGNKSHVAKNGTPGEGSKCNGKKGKDVIIRVPPGTQVINVDSGEVMLDLTENGERVRLLRGGKGGLGNVHFKGPANKAPTYAQRGIAGVSMKVRLELKLIADVALVGLPNAGKSSLISAMTNSRPKIAEYAFSTLVPNLGLVDIDHFTSFVIADIPGIIEGASSGKGLGITFLRHVERTKMMLFVVDFSGNIPQTLDILKREIDSHSRSLSGKPYAVAMTKIDLVSEHGLQSAYKEDTVDPKQCSVVGSAGTAVRACHSHGESEFIGAHTYISQELRTYRDLGVASLPRGALFQLAVSSVSRKNIDSLKYLMMDSLRLIDSASKECQV